MAALAEVEKKKKYLPGRKPVNIYAKGSPLVKAQQAQHNALGDIAQGTKDLVNKTFGTDHIVDAVKSTGSAIADAGEGFMGDVNKTRAITGKDALAMPEMVSSANAHEAEQPQPLNMDGQVPMANAESTGAKVPMANADNYGTDKQPPLWETTNHPGGLGDTAPDEGAAAAQPGTPMLSNRLGDSQGQVYGGEGVSLSQAPTLAGRKQRPDGSFGVGNMDVSFPEGTDPAVASRFLKNPDMGNEPLYPGPKTRSQRPLSSAGPGIKEPELISYETNPNMDWRQAAAINTARTKGYEAQKLAKANNASDKEIAAMKVQGLKDEEMLTQGGKNFRLDQLDEYTTQRDKTLAGYDKEHDERTAKSSLANAKERGQTVRGLKAKYIDPKHDNNNKKLPGTGKWVFPPVAGIDYNLSDDFSPDSDKISDADRAVFHNLAKAVAGGNEEAQEILDIYTQQYGLNKE